MADFRSGTSARGELLAESLVSTSVRDVAGTRPSWTGASAPPVGPGPEEHRELRQDRERAERTEHADKRAEEHHDAMRDRQQMYAKAARDHERELRARHEREAHEHEMHEHVEH